ncbi:MAG: flagellin [Desulfovibrionaceae bacterium]
MALSSDEKNFIFEYSQQLLTQDLLTSAYLSNSGVGRSLRDMVLARQPVQPLTNPYEEAITGTMRADAAAVRQNARNVAEAADMMSTAKYAVGQIKDALDQMEDIIDQINTGELDASSSVVQGEYDALKEKIDGIIANTDFNGISMLDSSKWGTEQIDVNGAVWIQSQKDGGFNITFNALDGLANLGDLLGSSLADSGDRATQLGYVQSLQSSVDAVLDRYTAKESSLSYEASQLESQAVVLDQAVDNRKSSGLSAEDILLNLILSDTGRLVDESS